ncbi:5'-3' exonuclease [Aureliella helgolandensis]|uniref:DNA polymerase I, thermostable n=1 Tax=Aureliella helgolandensis TaxID=2527968 RepID=A0A518GDQ5_9BACT|nr:5'-3' exonuclease H3TH domain-containing protein [Aureliella helgolandensis]QDV26722.1 DNA polymerase I, thermostable [Aureliella helgolandensis]
MTWLIVDGNNCYARDAFVNAAGAAHATLRRLRDVRANMQATRAVICWDSPSFRHELFAGYKAGRGEKPAGFQAGLDEVKAGTAAIGYESYECEGFEADDIAATVAAAAVDEGEQALIYSNDKDLHQCLVAGLVSQATAVRRPTSLTLSYDVLTAKQLKTKFGVHPHQWVDFRALTGDKSDGIPGCVDIGPKAAQTLLTKFDSLDEFYRKPFAAKIQDKQRRNLLAYREELAKARRLLRLVRNVPLPSTFYEAVAL